MKNKILALFALAIGLSATAQTKFGLKTGYVMSTIKEKNGNFSNSGDPKNSFYFGALLERKFNTKWAAQVELEYASLGGSDKINLDVIYDGNGNPISIGLLEQKVDLKTIIIPIGAKYYIIDGLSANAGISFMFYVDRNINYNLPNVNQGYSDRANKYLKTFNFAPYIGAEYQFYKGLFADTRYSFGTSNISQEIESGYKMHNSLWQLGIGYKF